MAAKGYVKRGPKHRVELELRQCYICGSNNTRIRKGRNMNQHWNCNRDNMGQILHYICKRCDSWLWRLYHPSYDRRTEQARIIRFGCKRVILNFRPRRGYCSNCGKSANITEMHHAKGYFIIFPWYGTVELCDPCHNKITAIERWRR